MLARQWRAQLDLSYEKREGRSVLALNKHAGPLRVQRSLYPEGTLTCHNIIVHPPGGIAAGDTLDVRVSLGDQSSALLTTPGAGKWYRNFDVSDGMDIPQGRQTLQYRLGAGAQLEWLPQETILFDGACADMATLVQLGVDACYLGWEILCFGRTASGERFNSGLLRSRTEILADQGALWREQGRLQAGEALFQSRAGLAGKTVSATLLAAGRDAPDEALAECRAISPGEDALAGVTRMPKLLIARWLGDSSEQARWYFQKLWKTLRPALTGREATTPRIWAT
ncbi:MAG TPA: urease accessory protein UreD [Burkholderiales bacterium]|nr:urease accessory protein UreD [Burkholderiales bacterium]